MPKEVEQSIARKIAELSVAGSQRFPIFCFKGNDEGLVRVSLNGENGYPQILVLSRDTKVRYSFTSEGVVSPDGTSATDGQLDLLVATVVQGELIDLKTFNDRLRSIQKVIDQTPQRVITFPNLEQTAAKYARLPLESQLIIKELGVPRGKYYLMEEPSGEVFKGSEDGIITVDGVKIVFPKTMALSGQASDSQRREDDIQIPGLFSDINKNRSDNNNNDKKDISEQWAYEQLRQFYPPVREGWTRYQPSSYIPNGLKNLTSREHGYVSPLLPSKKLKNFFSFCITDDLKLVLSSPDIYVAYRVENKGKTFLVTKASDFLEHYKTLLDELKLSNNL